MEPLLSVSIKSEATQLNLAQITMKSVKPAGIQHVLRIKRIGLLGQLSEDEVLLGEP